MNQESGSHWDDIDHDVSVRMCIQCTASCPHPRTVPVDQFYCTFPTACYFKNDEDISRALFGDTDEGTHVCVICYTSSPRSSDGNLHPPFVDDVSAVKVTLLPIMMAPPCADHAKRKLAELDDDDDKTMVCTWSLEDLYDKGTHHGLYLEDVRARAIERALMQSLLILVSKHHSKGDRSCDAVCCNVIIRNPRMDCINLNC